MARREEGGCPWWTSDRRATKPGGLWLENPPGGGSFAPGTSSLLRRRALRPCSFVTPRPGSKSLAAAPLRIFSQALSRNDAVGMGSAPAPGAAGRALAARIRRAVSKRFGAWRSVRVRREGAPNHSRGGCAPPPSTASFRLRRGGEWNDAAGHRELRSGVRVGQASSLSRSSPTRTPSGLAY